MSAVPKSWGDLISLSKTGLKVVGLSSGILSAVCAIGRVRLSEFVVVQGGRLDFDFDSIPVLD
jgi:hypothetical protein